MPPPSTAESWKEALASIRQVADLSAGLALVLVAGPKDRAREGLIQIHDALDDAKEPLWHRLDRQGPDLSSTLTEASSARPLLLVHGLELLNPDSRSEVEVRLNLLRDSLARFQALILFWIPVGELELFRQRCPDLFHWRALLVILDEEAVPLSPDVKLRREFLLHILESSDRLGRPLAPNQSLGKIYVEPLVKDETSLTTFSEWAERARWGVLEGDPGSGKTVAIRMHELFYARQALEEPKAPIPLLVKLRFLDFVPEPGDLVVLVESRIADLFPEPNILETWARQGQLWLLLDGFDEVPEEQRLAWSCWLERLRVEFPRFRVILTSRPRIVNLEGWPRARLMPWKNNQIRAFLSLRLSEPRDVNLFLQALPEDAGLMELARSPLMLELMISTWIVSGRLPTERTALLETYVDLLLTKRDAAKLLGRERPSTSPDFLRRQLSSLAYRGLVSNVNRFDGGLITRYFTGDSLRYLVARTGLLQEIEPGIYTFSHRVLFDYFAASGLVQHGPSTAFAQIRKHLDDPKWRDVILMAVVHLVRLNHREDWIWENLWPGDLSLDSGNWVRRASLSFDCAVEAGLEESLPGYIQEAREYLKQTTADSAVRSSLERTLSRLAQR